MGNRMQAEARDFSFERSLFKAGLNLNQFMRIAKTNLKHPVEY